MQFDRLSGRHSVQRSYFVQVRTKLPAVDTWGFPSAAALGDARPPAGRDSHAESSSSSSWLNFNASKLTRSEQYAG